MEEKMFDDFTKISVSGAAKDATTSKAKESLYSSNDFNKASRLFKSCAFTLVEESERNTSYIAKAASNPKVIEREDVGVLQAIANCRGWLSSDYTWAQGLTREGIIERLEAEKNDYPFVMDVLTSDQILNREDANQIIENATNCQTSTEANEYVRGVFTSIIETERQAAKAVEAMVTEATAPQVQDTTGFSK